MTIEKRTAYVLTCDGCAEQMAEGERFDSEAELLDRAGEFGWSVLGEAHYCDGCPNMPQGPVFIRACPPADRKGDNDG